LSTTHKILLIDGNEDSLSLIGNALTSHVQEALVERCNETSIGLGAVALGEFDLVVLHRTKDATQVELLKAIRKFNAHVPVLVVSLQPISRQILLGAGATESVTIGEWNHIGAVAARLLQSRKPAPA
jgi:DNA-binding NtrC family response regulator